MIPAFPIRGVAFAAFAASLAAAVAAPAQTRPAGGPYTMARCDELADLFDRRVGARVGEGGGSTASRLDRAVGYEQCRKGNFEDGIRQIEGALRRNLVAIPPAS